MTRPAALDLFCCAGGASEGLHRAGYDVTGIDIEPQPFYVRPERFRQVDALAVLASLAVDTPDSARARASLDLIWASPPCQAFTAYKRRPNHVAPRDNLIPQVRSLLRVIGIPYIIENVPGAPLESPITLCGSMFGLDVRRHRNFECSFPVDPPACNHAAQKPGRFPQATNRKNKRATVEVGVWRIPLDVQQSAMGINWMPLEQLSQAIPPAYAEFLGRAALAAKPVSP